MAKSKTSAQVLVDEITGELDFTPWTTTFTFEKSRRMRLDPTLQMARLYSVAPILAASWTVEGDEEEHVKLIKEQLLPLRTHLLSTYLFSEIDFGWKCYEKIFAIDEQGNTVIQEVKPLKCDDTRVRYDKNTGAFKGLKTVDLYTGSDIFIDAQHSLFVNFDEEGLGNYAVAGFQIAEKAYDEWNKCNAAAAKYDEKVAGVYLVVWHPEGKTKLNGVETDNGTIAQTIISTLRASGSVSIPVRVKNTIDQLNGFQSSKVWEVAFLTPGQMQGAFNERATYLDKLKARALGVTERSLFEGTYGTKAEAVTHASAVMLCKMLKHQQVTDYFNLRLVDQILWQNYHTKGTAKLVAQPLTDDRIDLFTRVFESLLSDPAAGLELKDAIDKKQLLESLRVPVEEGAVFDRAARDLPPADEDSQTKTVTETTKTQFSMRGRSKGLYLTRDGIRGKGDGPGGGESSGVEEVTLRRGKDVKVHRNPSFAKIKQMMKSSPKTGVRGVRGVLNTKTGNLFAWDAREAIHNEVIPAIGGYADDKEWRRFHIEDGVDDLGDAEHVFKLQKALRGKGKKLSSPITFSFELSKKKDPKNVDAGLNYRHVLQQHARAERMARKVTKLSLSQCPHEHCTTQINLPENIAKQVIEMSMKIADEDLAEDGREDEPHVTVLYGLQSLDGVEKAISGFGKVAITLGETSIFENDEYDVVKIDVDSEQLHRLNGVVAKLPNENKYDEYEPHVTLAYVKKGAGEKYVGMRDVYGAGFAADQVTARDRDGQGHAIYL